MSGICGIVNFDGAPVDPEILRRMTEAVKKRGPDGIHYWINGNVGLAHLALNTTPESLRERQPLLSPDGALCLTADARVDNRAELISTLTAKGFLRDASPTDADLILAAYQSWGEECPKHIVGDFAFAIWDARERKLFCARDPIGVRQLVYCQRNKTLFFGSRCASILTALGTIPPINRPFLQDMLAGQLGRWIDETAYEGILRVPPSYALVATSDKVALQRHWILGAQPAPRYKTDEEYIAHFRELFQDAVQARLRSVSPVGITLSGGLDSSSIAVMAERLIRSGKVSAPVRSYSFVFDQTPSADEREYLDAVVAECPHITPTLIPSDDCWGFRKSEVNSGYLPDEPEPDISRYMYFRLMHQLSRDGCRIILYGYGGDELFAGVPYGFPRLLRDVDFGRMPTEFKYFIFDAGYPAWQLLLIAYGYPFVPSGIRQLITRIRSSQNVENSQLVSFRQKENNAKKLLEPPCLSSRSAEEIYRLFAGGAKSYQLMGGDSLAAHFGIEYRVPFMDRQLIDYTLTLPPNFIFRNGYIKYMLRRALIDLLPKAVLQRTTKVHFGDLINLGAREKERRKIQELLEDSRLVRLHLVDSKRLVNAWNAYWHDNTRTRVPFDLVFFAGSEMWIRYFEKQTDCL